MNIVKKFLKVLKYLLGLYVTSVLLMFLLATISGGPYLAALITDNLMVRGPVIRLLHPMTTDKQMIANFQAKRADFEKIIQINNNVCLKDAAFTKSNYQENYEIGQLIKKIGLVSFHPGGGTLWFPAPYSADSKKKQDHLKKEYELNQYSNSIAKKMCKYYSVKFVWEKSATLPIYKGLVYFPEEPILKNGKIIEPADLIDPSPHNEREEKGVIENLIGKRLPDSDGCHFQKIDKNWFNFNCNYK